MLSLRKKSKRVEAADFEGMLRDKCIDREKLGLLYFSNHRDGASQYQLWFENASMDPVESPGVQMYRVKGTYCYDVLLRRARDGLMDPSGKPTRVRFDTILQAKL